MKTAGSKGKRTVEVGFCGGHRLLKGSLMTWHWTRCVALHAGVSDS